MKQQAPQRGTNVQEGGFPKGTRTFHKMVASFLVMLVLPFLTLLANYLYARQLLQEENLNYQNAVLLQAQKMVDERLQSLQLFAIDISNDATIKAFLDSDSLSGRDLNVKIWEISQHIKTYSASYRDLCQCMVYAANYDVLIRADGADSQVSQKMIRLDSPQLNALLQQRLQDRKLYCQYELLQDGAGGSALVMLHSVPLWSTGRKATGAICLLIDTEELFHNIRTMEELQPGLVCLLDDARQPGSAERTGRRFGGRRGLSSLRRRSLYGFPCRFLHRRMDLRVPAAGARHAGQTANHAQPELGAACPGAGVGRVGCLYALPPQLQAGGKPNGGAAETIRLAAGVGGGG